MIESMENYDYTLHIFGTNSVRTLFKARLETGAGIHAPLIVEGKSGRLTPERYKKFVDKYLKVLYQNIQRHQEQT